MKITQSILLFAGFMLLSAGAFASDHCISVKGRVTSQTVAVFSNGVACPSPVGICTEGRFTGGLKGRFRFVAGSLDPFNNGGVTPDVFATTGVLTSKSKLCRGSAVFNDTSAFATTSVAGDTNLDFASIQTLDGNLSTGRCSGATGRVRIQGLFDNGCVDCRYQGRICGVVAAHDDDDDDDEDEDDD